MALSDKDIIITPNRGQSSDPKIEFKGADSTLGPQTISLNVYPTDNGTLSFDGSAGQLFSITNSLSGTIYSVNDVSGIPSIEVLDTGLIKLGQYGGNILIGTGTDNGSKLQINGEFRNGSTWLSGGSTNNAYNENIRLFAATNGASVIAFNATGTSGSPAGAVLGYSDRIEIRSTSDSIVHRFYNNYSLALGSSRAPIFYDSDNTAYYIDAASTSNINTLTAAGKITIGTFSNSTVNNGEAWFGRASDRNAGTYTVQLGTSNSAIFEVVDYAWTKQLFIVNSSGVVTANNDMRAPVFYDSNNTAYYIDAASTSNLLGLTVTNTISGSVNGNAATVTNGIYSTGGNLFSGSGSFRAFSIRTTDASAANWSWFALGGTSDSAGNVWHIATNGTATDLGTAGALHIRGNNGASTSIAINQDHSIRFRSSTLYAGATTNANGNTIWHSGNDGSGSGLDADLLDGYGTSTNSTASSVAVRDASGDINVRLIRQEYTDQATISGGMVFRVNNSTDNYLRVCNDVSAIRTFLGASASSHNHSGTYVERDEVKSFGTVAVQAVAGSSVTCTTAQFITWLENVGFFDYVHSYAKCTWDYAGNNDISDTGFGSNFELAGCVIETWTDNSDDTTRGQITVRITAPTTGGTAGGKILVYNDQGPGYSPGWRQVWNSLSDGDGSGLDADLLDGNQASAFALSSHTHDYVPERNRSDWNDSTVIDDVIGQLAWKNYGNGHTIFDASAGTAPGGTAKNNTNPDVSWTSTYPTLMGWNGTNTYGVRVDSARTSDQLNGTANYLRSDISATNSVDLRVPILYDSIDTGYSWNPNTNSAHRLQTPSGYLDLGPMNTSYCHFSTDRSNFYFGTNIVVNGGFKIYGDENTRLTQSALVIRGASPTIYLRDTDQNVAMLHNNSSLFYILRGATDSEAWTQVNGYWPVYWDLTNNNATFGGSIWAAGSVTAYSDAKLKDNVVTVDNALEKTLKLRGVYYTRKDDLIKERRVGVIAQEVKEVLPEVVRLHQDKEDKEGTYAVDYGNITGLLIEAIKEQQNQIEELKDTVNKLVKLLGDKS